MGSLRVHVRATPLAMADTAHATTDVMEALGLGERSRVHLATGSGDGTTVQLVLRRASRGHGRHARLFLPAAALRRLAIRPGSSLRLRRLASGRLHLGPVVAILTCLRGRVPSTFPWLHHVYREAERGGALACFLTPEGVRSGRRWVTGFLLAPDGRFRRAHLPWPDVVYNRIPNRRSERAPLARQALAALRQRPGCHVFNPVFFDKWIVWSTLAAVPELRRHLPPSQRWRGAAGVRQMLARHRTLYLKPTAGTKGHGIIRVQLAPARRAEHGPARRRSGSGSGASRARAKGSAWYYRVDRVAEAGQGSRRFRHWSSLADWLDTSLRGRSYVVQGAVALTRVGGAQIDFRASVQKDARGRWFVAGLAAKAAQRGGITTHVRHGGRVLPADSALQRAFPGRARLLRSELERLALRASEALEAATGWQLGELGWDLALDSSGHAWILECNSKPGRTIFRLPSLLAADAEAAQQMAAYMVWLAGFSDGAGLSSGGISLD